LYRVLQLLDFPRLRAPYRVRLGAPNPHGLYDLLGNVWEWCADEQRPYAAEPVTDPRHMGQDRKRVCRGGSWEINTTGSEFDFLMRYAFAEDKVNSVRAARRLAHPRSSPECYIGFRLAAGHVSQPTDQTPMAESSVSRVDATESGEAQTTPVERSGLE